jgi:hypothetical protein
VHAKKGVSFIFLKEREMRAGLAMQYKPSQKRKCEEKNKE